MVISGQLELSMEGDADIHDITGEVGQLVWESGMQDGVVTIFTPSATSALTTIEYEPNALTDFRRLFNKIERVEKPISRAALLGPSLSVPFVAGQLTLGTWQKIVFVDFDDQPRQRWLVVQIMGE